MKFGDITIRIRLDESKLTIGQQIQANKSDINIMESHPGDIGLEILVEQLPAFVKSKFAYLKDGQGAISIEVEED